MKDGKEHKVSIIAKASHKWKEIASQLSDDPNRATAVGLYCRESPEDCLRQLFVQDFFNKTPANNYSQDWNGIIELLKNVEMETLAEEVREALRIPRRCTTNIK